MAGEDGRPDTASGDPASDADLARRLDVLSRDLHAERQERAEADRSRSNATGYGVAVRLGSEFIAAVLVGAALGWGLDKLAGTSPWGLVVLLLLGFAAGVTNVVRVAGASSSTASGRNDQQGGAPPR